jgi:hypothetical protein
MAFLERARALYQALDDETGLARIEGTVAIATLMQGQVAEALEMAAAARERYRANGDAMYEALAGGTIAFGHMMLGEMNQAFRAGIDAIQLSHALRDVATTVITLSDSVVALAAVGRLDDAATTLGAYFHLCDLHGVQPPGGVGPGLDASLVETLSTETHAAAMHAGRSMSLDQAVAFIVGAAERALSEGDQP